MDLRKAELGCHVVIEGRREVSTQEAQAAMKSQYQILKATTNLDFWVFFASSADGLRKLSKMVLEFCICVRRGLLSTKTKDVNCALVAGNTEPR
jgi:hypothetical protein